MNHAFIAASLMPPPWNPMFSPVLGPANALFLGRDDLVLLVIDPAKVGPAIKYEGAPGSQQFPHIYGPLNLDAVVAVMALPRGRDGTFTFTVAATS